MSANTLHFGGKEKEMEWEKEEEDEEKKKPSIAILVVPSKRNGVELILKIRKDVFHIEAGKALFQSGYELRQMPFGRRIWEREKRLREHRRKKKNI